MRWTWWHFAALVGLGVALTVVSLMLDWPFGGFFLLLPLIFPPLRFGGSKAPQRARRCSKCDYVAFDSGFDYCPRDGSRLSDSL